MWNGTHSRKLSHSVLIVTIIVTAATGCGLVRDRDSASVRVTQLKDTNAPFETRDNHTAFVPRQDLAAKIRSSVQNVSDVTVLQRHQSAYVALATTRTHAKQAERDAQRIVRSTAPDIQRVYVSSDESLVNHFHQFAVAREHAEKMGSNLIMNDIERVFPNSH